MNSTKKFAITVGLGFAVATACAGTAQASVGEHSPMRQHSALSGGHKEHGKPTGVTCVNTGGASAWGYTKDSGLLSGNNVQHPVNVPINFCGNTINIFVVPFQDGVEDGNGAPN